MIMRVYPTASARHKNEVKPDEEGRFLNGLSHILQTLSGHFVLNCENVHFPRPLWEAPPAGKHRQEDERRLN